MPRSLVAPLAFVAVCAAERGALAQNSDAYDVALQKAGALSASGDHLGAATLLDEVAFAYPQDYAIAVRCAFEYFSAGRWEEAESAYRVAIDRAPASREARVGLAWTLAREGRCSEAMSAVASVEHESAAPIERLCTPLTRTLSAQALAAIHTSNPVRSYGLGAAISLDSTISTSGMVGLSWRFLHTSTSASSGVSAYDQGEVYARAGIGNARAGAQAIAGLILDGSGTLGTSEHFGFVTHLRPSESTNSWTGELRLEAALSLYKDLSVARLAPSWDWHVAGPLHLIPGVALQSDGASLYPNAQLTLALSWPSFSLWAGGKYGDEVRPAMLGQSVVYDLTERVAWGVWAGLRVRVSGALSIQGSYSFDLLRSSATTSSGLSSLSVGPVINF